MYGRGSRKCRDGGVFEPFVSVIVPAHNEERVIGRLLGKICEFSYPKERFEVLVVDDGSTDSTGEIVEAFANKHGFIKPLHRRLACGKATALNEALKRARGEFVYFFDADYVPDVNFIEVANSGFSDSRVGVVQCYIGVLNLDKRVSKVVCLERVGGYRVDQLARDILGLVPQFGGTAGGVRRGLLDALGGFDEHVLAEDTDLTFRVYLAGYKVRYLLEVGSYEEAVEDWRGYWRQKSRWAKGHMQCAFKHFLPLLKSGNLSFREKLDGLLLLFIYFVPVLIGLGWILGGLCFLFGYGLGGGSAAFVLTLIYFISGNIAPLSEVIVGVILEKRLGFCKYTPLLFVAFVLNVFICCKAFVDVLFWMLRGKHRLQWDKTVHKGT
ncbi:MAG: glycosyltransferase family 2 protein [Candidatus Bathyarchaeota archaeon]|nr:glycosyltransferase family 2 protein [Candidatus Bathyarchaeota archaeon]